MAKDNVTPIDKKEADEDLRASLLKQDNLPEALKQELAKGRNYEKYEQIEKIIEDLGGTANINEIQIAFYNRHEEHIPRGTLVAGLGKYIEKSTAKITRGEKQGTYTIKE